MIRDFVRSCGKVVRSGRRVILKFSKRVPDRVLSWINKAIDNVKSLGEVFKEAYG